MSALDATLQSRLAQLESAGLLRNPRPVTGPQGPEIELDGRRVLCLCSNNYLGLASHPDLAEAARAALAAEGVGAGASRLISGTMEGHRRAEARLADYLRVPAALLFATGYAANVGILQSLLGPDDVIFSDELNHASIIDGCRLSKAEVVVYPHGDTDRLAELLATRRPAARHAVVVTDAVFSMDGDPAPVRALRQLCDAADAWLVVDEAHAVGVLGPQGRGLCAEQEVRPDVLMGTLGKSFGVAGAFVAGSQTLIRFLTNRARSFVFSTAPPPALAAAVARAVDLVEDGDPLRAQLARNAQRLRDGLRSQGWNVEEGLTPIIPVLLGHPDTTMNVSNALLDRGIFAQGIRPPTVPAGTSRLRLTPMATHEDHHVDRALEAFAEVRKELL